MDEYTAAIYDEYTDNLYGIGDEAYEEPPAEPTREVIDDIPF